MRLQWLSAASLSAAIALVCLPGTAAASDGNDVTATIARAVAAFNKGDMKTWAAACASPAAVIDDFPPHEWQGPTACADWVSAYTAYCKKMAITAGKVTLGRPWHVDVTGARAYAVFPATFAFLQKGKPVKETAAAFTFALEKTAAAWLITGWAWGQR